MTVAPYRTRSRFVRVSRCHTRCLHAHALGDDAVVLVAQWGASHLVNHVHW